MVDPTTSSQVLNRIAQEVSPKHLESHPIQAFIDGMLEIAAGKGHDTKDTRQVLGLAAPQVGVSKRVILIDITANGAMKKQNLIAVINPVIIHKSKETVPGREGCWSCDNICGNVERSKEVTLEGLDRYGDKLSLHLIDFVARIAQHETDHLDGIRFPDRIPATEASKLHWVMPEQFEDYRTNWEHWPALCPRDRWERLKVGQV
jgi:peptide deformylase